MSQIQFIVVKKVYQILGVIFKSKSKSVGFMLEEQFFPNFVVKNGKSNPEKKHYIGLLIPLETTP
jgi:hypothetical protein